VKNRPDTLAVSALALRQRLYNRGFAPGAPGTVPLLWLEIDRRAAHEMRCPTCGEHLTLEAFHHGDQYAALAVCKECGFGEEC
jgi:hypothetical protein